MFYADEVRKVFLGLNSLVERYLFEQKLHGGKRIPRGFYHAVMTKEESEDFDCWRKVRKGKSRRRPCYTSAAKPLNSGSKRPTKNV